MGYPRCNRSSSCNFVYLSCSAVVYTVEANCQGRFNVKPKQAWLSISVLIYCWNWPLFLLDSQSQRKENTLSSPLPTSLLVLSPPLLPVPCCDLCRSALSCNSFTQNEDKQSLTHLYTNNESCRLYICCKKLASFNKAISRIWAALQPYQFLWSRSELLRSAKNLSL